jgi:ComEC/Rec2-related protein
MAIRAIGLSLGLISGIVLASMTDWALSPLLLVAISLVAAAALVYEIIEERRWREWPTLGVLLAAFICAMPLGYWRTATLLAAPAEGSLRSALSQLSSGSALSVRGNLCRETELRKPGQADVYVRVDQIRVGANTNTAWQTVSPNNVLVRIYAQKSASDTTRTAFNELAAPESYGYRIELTARFYPLRAAKNPGEFDYGAFLQRDGLVARLKCHVNRAKILERSRGNLFTEVALLAKTDFLKTYKQTIRNPASRLISAATLGTRRAVENVSYRGLDIAKTFRHAGVGHVLAVSGLHVSVVTVLLYSLFRLAGIRVRVFVPALIVFLILFALLTGARPSSMRAVIMNSVVLISLAYFRCGLRRATAIGLSLSSFLILLRSPTVLYAPSFLLSYGAVLSLVTLATPMDRWLRTFRGFSLLFFLVWFSLLMTIASQRFHLLVDPRNLIGLFGLLWLLTRIGSALNHRWPRTWRFGLERFPPALRMFFGAQLAIQIGMMVPMSAWFFGQFPVAGVLVNLLAIPAIGVLVQLGMLTGLLGLIPVVGHVVALPFGAAATVIGEGFFRLAHAGATWFPFPATPRPTGAWIAAYYGAVALLLVADLYRIPLLSIMYRRHPEGGFSKGRRHLLWVLPLLVSIVPLWNCLPGRPRCTSIQCLASGRYPIVTMPASDGSAVIVNAGAKLAGERLLFDSLRTRGASRVETVVLCSADPQAGMEGAAALLGKMRIEQCLLPVVPTPKQSFLEALGDDYTISQAKQGERWALQYETAFDALEQALAEKKVPWTKIQNGELCRWKNGSLVALPRYDGTPARFAASARTPILEAVVGGLRWLIITDTSSAAVKQTLAANEHYDVIIVPDMSSRSSFRYWLERAVRSATPQMLIVAGERENDTLELSGLAAIAPELTILVTSRDGAVSATFEGDGATKLRTHLTLQEFVLRPL